MTIRSKPTEIRLISNKRKYRKGVKKTKQTVHTVNIETKKKVHMITILITAIKMSVGQNKAVQFSE